MRRFRLAVTVTLMTTALCADRAGAAAPSIGRPQLSAARQFAQRLTCTFRQALPSVGFTPERSRDAVVRLVPQTRGDEAPVLHATVLSPFRFRLPPPSH